MIISIDTKPVSNGWLGTVQTDKSSYLVVFFNYDQIVTWIKENIPAK